MRHGSDLSQLPQELRQTVLDTVGDADFLEVIERSKDRTLDKSARWIIYAITGRRFTTIFLEEGGKERVKSLSLDRIKTVEIGDVAGTIHVESEEGEFSTGVSVDAARAILRAS